MNKLLLICLSYSTLFILFGNTAIAHASPSSCFSQLFEKIRLDYYSYYTSYDPLYTLGGIAAFSGALAYSDIDKETSDWWQNDVRSSFSKDLAKSGFTKIREEGIYLLPVYVFTYCTAHSVLPRPYGTKVSTWAERTFRSLILGSPQQIFLTHLMGSRRPTDSHTSRWHPFKPGHNRGVSGHAFYGSLPFLNAATVTTHPLGKATWYLLSVLPAWARLEENKHYLSQILAGWGLAFLMTEHIRYQNTSQETNFFIVPMGRGASLQFQRSF